MLQRSVSSKAEEGKSPLNETEVTTLKQREETSKLFCLSARFAFEDKAAEHDLAVLNCTKNGPDIPDSALKAKRE